jgi:predicted ATPase/class 3 adenylate cyclase
VSQSRGSRTATFLMSDIAGSTRLWEEQREAMVVALAAHDVMLRLAVEEAGGTVFKTTGDGMLAAFDDAESAVTAAIEGQHALDRHDWPETGRLHVRMAIHTGSAEVRDGDFFGRALNRVARLMAIGHGDQVLVSGTTMALVAGGLPNAFELIDLGEHGLRDLDRAEHVYQLAGPGLRREFPPLRTTAEHPTNLRPQATSFVGRERELAQIGRLLARSRVVTLVGVGGTGKTRLELQAAADALEHYRDGAWLVELAPLSDPELVAGEIGHALGVQLDPGRPPIETIVDFLRSKDLLLLLDNCEHLIAAAADAAQRLVGSCQSLTLLATSREPLGVDGEAIVAVPSLALPDAADEHDAEPLSDEDLIDRADRSEAVRLFVERAAATLPTFSLDRSNVRAVVEICRRLDGIPLALELAAARVNVLSADEIAQGLGDRFRLLTGGRRTAVPRQRTLQALIDWSWDLLDDDDRRLLRRLSVFAGGWTLDAAAAVAFEEATVDGTLVSGGSSASARFAAIDGLGRLADRSLVAVDHEGSTRYRMLETIRQYAADKLATSGEAVALRDRHLGVLLGLARDAEHGLDGPESSAWLHRLDAEVDNVRSALDWALETRPEAGLEICVALTRYWSSRTMGSEGYDRFMQAVDRVRALPEAESAEAARARSSLIARGLAGAAMLASMGGRFEETVALGDEALAAARGSGDPAALADALVVWLYRADPRFPPGLAEDWRPAAEEARGIVTGLEDWWRLGRLESEVAMIEARHDPAAAEESVKRAVAAAERSGNPQELGFLDQMRGRLAAITGRNAEAEGFFRAAHAHFESIGDHRFALSAQSELGHALRHEGRVDEAEAEYRGAIRGWQRTGNRGAVANQLESFAFLAQARGDWVRSARLFGAAEALREVADARMTAMEAAESDAAMLRLRQTLDEGALGSAWAEGRRMTAEAAVAFALSG